jgi:hypothetical protein
MSIKWPGLAVNKAPHLSILYLRLLYLYKTYTKFALKRFNLNFNLGFLPLSTANKGARQIGEKDRGVGVLE